MKRKGNRNGVESSEKMFLGTRVGEMGNIFK